MKYSAAFAASVASKPDLNAYSGHLFFWQGSYMETNFQFILNKSGKRACSWPAPGMGGNLCLPQGQEAWGRGGGRVKREARNKDTASRSRGFQTVSLADFAAEKRGVIRNRGSPGGQRKEEESDHNISCPLKKNVLILHMHA